MKDKHLKKGLTSTANEQQSSNYSDEELDEGECMAGSSDSEEKPADCSSSSR
jgi:hypothetical protein